MKKLLILSGKGGTGKTTTAAAFIYFSKTHLFADCDVDAPNLHLVAGKLAIPENFDYMGSKKAKIQSDKCISCGSCQAACRFEAIICRDGKYFIDEFSCEGCGVCQMLCPEDAILLQDDVAGEVSVYQNDRVFVTAELKMGKGNSGKLVAEVKKKMVQSAKGEDIAIIDGAPGIGCPVIASMSGVDLVLIVAEPSVSGISDLKRILQTADVFHTRPVVCVNKWDTSPIKTREIEDFCAEHDILYAGRIPYDREVAVANNNGISVAETNGSAAKALQKIYNYTIEVIEEA